jgi:hypothetical protein
MRIKALKTKKTVRSSSSRIARRTAAPAPAPVSRDVVSKKAYEIFERRGYRHGQDVQDWLEAEKLCGCGQ